MNEAVGLEPLTAIARGMWRYRWYAVAALWFIILVGWPLAYVFTKPVFTAKAQIYIDTQSILSPVLKGLTLPTNPSEQLGLMSRQLLAGPNLERVVAQTGLDGQGARTTEGVNSEASPGPAQSDIVLEGLRKSISLTAERTSSESGYTNFYSITYSNRDPVLAEKVVQALIDAFAENTLAQIKQDAEQAIVYLDGQIAARKEQIMRAERRLREFQRTHVGALVSGSEGYFKRLSSAREELQGVDLEIRQTSSRLLALQRQLDATPPRVRAVARDGTPIPSSAEQRLLELTRELDLALLKYTESHPEIGKLRNNIAQAQAEMRRGPGSAPAMVNPLYEQLQLWASETEATLAELRTKKELYTLRAEDLRAQMETLPQIEDDLRRLSDESNKITETYQALITRRQAIENSRKLSEDESEAGFNEDLKFRVIEPPSVPVDSSLLALWKRRLMLAAAVLGAGFAGGAALSYLLLKLRPPVFSQRELGEMMGLPVHGVISQVTTPAWRLRQRLDALAFVLCALLAFAAAAASIHIQHGLTYSDSNVQATVNQSLPTGETDVSQDGE